jgi:hypothetical protein
MRKFEAVLHVSGALTGSFCALACDETRNPDILGNASAHTVVPKARAR